MLIDAPVQTFILKELIALTERSGSASHTHTHTLALPIIGVSEIVWMSNNCTAPDVLLRTPNVRDALRKKLVLPSKAASEIAWVSKNCTTHDLALRTHQIAKQAHDGRVKTNTSGSVVDVLNVLHLLHVLDLLDLPDVLYLMCFT